MVKLKLKTRGGKYVLVMILSDKNVELIKAGRPIAFPGSDFQMPDIDKVIIGHGPTEEVIVERLKNEGVLKLGDIPFTPPPPEPPKKPDVH